MSSQRWDDDKAGVVYSHPLSCNRVSHFKSQQDFFDALDKIFLTFLSLLGPIMAKEGRLMIGVCEAIYRKCDGCGTVIGWGGGVIEWAAPSSKMTQLPPNPKPTIENTIPPIQDIHDNEP